MTKQGATVVLRGKDKLELYGELELLPTVRRERVATMVLGDKEKVKLYHHLGDPESEMASL